jgi:hypothetical protein
MLFDHRFYLTGYQSRTSRAAPFSRSQSAGTPTLLGQPLYPSPDCRSAYTEFPNGIIDATFQTASTFEICLDKRTQHGRPAHLFRTNGNGAFAIFVHRYLPHTPVNPISGLRAKISELKAKSHI